MGLLVDSESRKVEFTNDCICSTCPSYVPCGEKGVYCMSSVGKSKCIKIESGCICKACPVTKKAGLKNFYFCTRGSELDQLER